MQTYHHFLNFLRSHHFAPQFPFPTINKKITSRVLHITHTYFTRLTHELLLILPIGLLVVLLINIFAPKSQFDITKENILQNPTASQHHSFLAQQLLVTNQLTQAETQAQLSGDRDLLSQIYKIKSQPEEARREILELQKIIGRLPGYRDAYIKLAILNWRLYRPFDAKKYLEKSLEIDPNNKLAKKISLILN